MQVDLQAEDFKGFGQKKGIDFDEIFSPIVKMSSICVALGMAASIDLEVDDETKP